MNMGENRRMGGMKNRCVWKGSVGDANLLMDAVTAPMRWGFCGETGTDRKKKGVSVKKEKRN